MPFGTIFNLKSENRSPFSKNRLKRREGVDIQGSLLTPVYISERRAMPCCPPRRRLLFETLLISLATIVLALIPCTLAATRPVPSQEDSDIARWRYAKCREYLHDNMPISSEGKIMAHHHDARSPKSKWNEKERWLPMDLSAPCTIWYVGANIRGADGIELQSKYACRIHVFEPVAAFATLLEGHWAELEVPRAEIHRFGLGSHTRNVSGVVDRGESTFAMMSSDSIGGFTVEIRSISQVWKDFGSPRIDLLHVNCEGCEWELWKSIFDNDMAQHIRTMQVGTHAVNAVIGGDGDNYCGFEQLMRRTHNVVFKQAYAWERWVLMEAEGAADKAHESRPARAGARGHWAMP
jgi:FkbM family methyltransferase